MAVYLFFSNTNNVFFSSFSVRACVCSYVRACLLVYLDCIAVHTKGAGCWLAAVAGALRVAREIRK